MTNIKRLYILSEAEIADLYSLPDFNTEERALYFEMNQIENECDIPSEAPSNVPIANVRTSMLVKNMSHIIKESNKKELPQNQQLNSCRATPILEEECRRVNELVKNSVNHVSKVIERNVSNYRVARSYTIMEINEEHTV